MLAARETQERVLSDARTTGLTAFLAVTGFALTIFALHDLGLGSDPTVVAVLPWPRSSPRCSAGG